MRHIPMTALVVVALCACSTGTKQPADPAAVRAAIEATNAKLEGWYATAQVDSVVAAYASDATLLGPNMPAAVGRDAIRAQWTGLVSAGVPHFSIKTVAVHVADSLAIEHGHYTLQLRAKAPADTSKLLMDDRGNYVVAWVHRDGTWLLLYDIATSELPLPTVPAKK
jgi:ketosteroid isomerase-like protein